MGVQISVHIRPCDRQAQAHRAQMLAVAKLLVPHGIVPNWLTEVLSHFSSEVTSSRSIAQAMPTMAELNKAMRSIEKHARSIQELMRLPFAAGYLSIKSAKNYEGRTSLEAELSNLISATRAALSGQVKRGAGKPHLVGNLPAKLVCAAIVAEAWAQLHGEAEPAPTNRHVQAAAQELWKDVLPQAKQEEKSWGDDRLSSWRHHLKLARGPEAQTLRAEVRRVFKICAARAVENNSA